MYRPLLESVRAEVSGHEALASVRALARFHRVQASAGYDEAAAWVAERLRAFGYEPEWSHVPGDGRSRALGILMPRGWHCTRGRAALIRGSAREPLCDAETEPLSVILRSAPMRGAYPLVAVDDGTEARHYDRVEVRGRVVLTAGAVHRVHELAVLERGAAGLLSHGRRLFPPVRGEEDDDGALPYTSFWWGPGMPRGWGFVVSPATGRRLRAGLAAGETLGLEAEIDAHEFETRIPLLTASLRGTTDAEVLVVAHLCHPQPSANDNASGAAALLETARVLARLVADGRWRPGARGVRFLWMPELTGTCAWLALDRARASRVSAALNLDMVGEDQAQCGSTLLVEDPPCFAATFAEALLRDIRRDAQDWITSYAGPGYFSLVRMAEVPYGGGSDHAVLADPMVGIPCPMLIQWPDRYYHSSHDTPDRCDADSLALAARCAATYAASLSTLDRAGGRALLERVGLDARRRVLAAAARAAAERAVAAARLAGRAAITSMTRILDEPERVAAALGLFEAFCSRETGAGAPPAPAGLQSDASPAAACPRRTLAGPLDFHTHLWPGYETLTREERERLRALFEALPGGRATLDIAWAACDGRRTLGEIARLVEIETGLTVPAAAVGGGPTTATWHDVFGWMERLGLASRAPETAARWTLEPSDPGSTS
jgi:hypothetical protein